MGGFSTIGGDRASIVIVAASDTPYKLKARADYVCTGTNTTGGDENVINMALQEGKTVLLLPGTYWLSGPILPDNDQMLIGSGMSTILKLRDNHNANIYLINTNYKNNIIVRDLMLDGNKDNQSSGNQSAIQFINGRYCKVIRCYMMNFRYRVLVLNYSDFCVVDSCVVRDCLEYGILLYYSNNNIVANNCVENTGYDGIFLNNSNYNVVVHNILRNNGASGSYSGIYLYGASNHNIVKSNICFGNNFVNIRLRGSYNLVFGNICRHNNISTYGIFIDVSTATNNIIHGNDLYSSGLSGDIYDAGTNTRKRDNIGNDGAWLIDA